MNIGIVGAGICGRVTALYLARAGHQVEIFEQRAEHQQDITSYTAAGMLTPYAELECAQPDLFEMGLASLSLWSELAASMREDIAYQAGGTLMLAHPQDRAELHRLSGIFQRTGLLSSPQVSSLDREVIAQLEPELSERFDQGFYLHNEASVDAAETMRVLLNELQHLQVQTHFVTPVQRIRANEIELESRKLSFDCVIDCRGLQARDVLPTLRGVRGELLVLEAPDVQISHLIRLLHPRYRLYIAPQTRQRYIVGASQIESDDQRPISARSTLELLSAAVSLHSGFAEASIIESRVHCRPTLPDNEPRIFVEPGLLRVNGLYRHGYLLSPLVASEVTRLLSGDETGSGTFPNLIERTGEVCNAVAG
ncbi:MAG: glycine oxidase ThiO [Reinekea sp.]